MNEGAFRGILLVGVAVVIGLLLLSSGLDDTSPVTIRDEGDQSATDNIASDTSDPSTQETVVPSDIEPSTIPVVVANGSGVSGAAGSVTEVLIAAGYQPGDPTDTTVPVSETPLDTVYYVTTPTSFQAQAETVAESLGLPAEAVAEMPDPAPADFGLAGVLVVLGSSPGGLAQSATAATTPTTTG